MSAPQLKVTYFDGTGRAEFTRLLLVFGNVEFVDERIQGVDFPALKATLPLGQLPTLEVNGTTYAQSMAMARYAAKVSGLMPTDPVAALRVDMISETLVDIMNAFVVIVFGEKDEAVKAEKTKKFVEETVPKTLAVLETMVQGKFFLGDSASYADVHLFDLLQNGLKPRFTELSTAAYPKLEAVMESVKANANIAAYLAKHQNSFTYFNHAGRGELTRLLLVFANIEFVDNRSEFDDFPALKPTLPLGQLPLLEVNGTTYLQSMAMARYAVKLGGLYPQAPLDALRVDMVSDTLTNLMNTFVAIVYGEKDEAVKAKETKQFVSEGALKALRVLEAMVQGKSFLGETPSYADVHLFDLVSNSLKSHFAELSTAAFPKLEAVMENVKVNANIAAYLAKHQH